MTSWSSPHFEMDTFATVRSGAPTAGSIPAALKMKYGAQPPAAGLLRIPLPPAVNVRDSSAA
jgi:hypothetical protein